MLRGRSRCCTWMAVTHAVCGIWVHNCGVMQQTKFIQFKSMDPTVLKIFLMKVLSCKFVLSDAEHFYTDPAIFHPTGFTFSNKEQRSAETSILSYVLFAKNRDCW